MKMTKASFMAVVIMAMVFSATCLYAGGAWNATQGEGGKEAHFKKMVEELQLTPQQKEALDKDRAEFDAKSKDLRDKAHQARMDLKQELDKPTSDKSRIGALASELKALAGQQIDNRIDQVMALKKILTPEQFDKMKSSMERHMKDRPGKHGYKDKMDGEHGPPPPDAI